MFAGAADGILDGEIETKEIDVGINFRLKQRRLNFRARWTVFLGRVERS